MRRPPLLLTLALLAPLARAALPTPDPDDGGLTLPPGFRAVVFADNLVVNRLAAGQRNDLRFLAVAANGDVYAKTKRGPLLALRDTDGDGRADLVREFGGGGGTGLMLHGNWLYHSTDREVLRYRYTPGELVPSGEPEAIVVDLPNQRSHESKTFFFDDAGALFVETGSPSNSYGGANDRRRGARGSDATDFLRLHGGFWRFDPDRPNQRQSDGRHYSTGHRHVVAAAWNPAARAAFIVMHGRDNLHDVAPEHYSEADNAELPAEEFHQLREGLDLGWPYTYYDPVRRARMVAPEFGGDGRRRAEPGRYPDPLVAFPAHWAPLQMAAYTGTQFPARYRGGLFVAFHGSWNRAPLPQRGYNVCFIPFVAGRPTGGYEVFADGFAGRASIASPREARYRPGGVAVGPDGSLYVGDTRSGRIWRIFYTGEAAAVPAAGTAAPAGGTEPVRPIRHPEGRGLYTQVCASCHMPDGGGVPGLQPSLLDSPVARGEADTLVRVILHGPAAVLPADRPRFANVMPPYSALFEDAQVAALANYLRELAGGDGAAVTPERVAALRAAP
ncbi:MAG: c-type cytochrome [Opitutaceae bacterium]|nr:c-type cytochrome [Opitutaceae bacterium]